MEDDDEKKANALVQALIENQALEERASYLRRGRPLAQVETQTIAEAWTKAFKAWFYHPDRPKRMQQAFADASAELALRGEPTPDETIRTELQRGMEEARHEGPHDPGVRDAINKFMDSLDTPRN